MTKPEKRIEFDANVELMREYRRIDENSKQVIALIENIERSLSVINAETSLELMFTQDELAKISDVQDAIPDWIKTIEKIKPIEAQEEIQAEENQPEEIINEGETGNG